MIEDDEECLSWYKGEKFDGKHALSKSDPDSGNSDACDNWQGMAGCAIVIMNGAGRWNVSCIQFQEGKYLKAMAF